MRFVDGVNPKTDLFLLDDLDVKIEIPIRLGSLGSFLAHRRLWKEVKGLDYVWIMEDDTYFKGIWRRRVNESLHLLESDKPVVIKMCAFHITRNGLENNTPPSDAIKVSEGLYKVKYALSNLSYLANKAFINKLWDECDTIKGRTLDWAMQEVVRQSECYAFYPSIVVQASECKSIRNSFEEPKLNEDKQKRFERICMKYPYLAKIQKTGDNDLDYWLSKKFVWTE